MARPAKAYPKDPYHEQSVHITFRPPGPPLGRFGAWGMAIIQRGLRSATSSDRSIYKHVHPLRLPFFRHLSKLSDVALQKPQTRQIDLRIREP
ncbi:hypothetical protein PGTUg99_033145 [Puccinia graminis f. sp. tritici]|uniref:Uncharacterized protein n=1 Tax=Puccinia graminis f. sp. tritici TaxID=56615 RepID=A0A5B0RUL5_PUCGR|nr:hypothetical protein PGTUg99_033145 [Puccinia graminis f. sp. tritici]